MGKKLFISRDLTPESPFWTLGMEVFNQSLLCITEVDFEWDGQADWLFFYSANGVKFFLEKNLEIESLNIACIGQSTALAAEKGGLKVDFVGDGKPESTAANFSKLVIGQKVVFVGAANSRQSVMGLLPDSVEKKHLVVYDNVPISDFEIPLCDILVFTSPQNARVYFSKYTYQNGQKLVAIGKTTEAELLDLLGEVKVLLPDSADELGLVKVILSKE